jgi:hypothetical protein
VGDKEFEAVGWESIWPYLPRGRDEYEASGPLIRWPFISVFLFHSALQSLIIPTLHHSHDQK